MSQLVGQGTTTVDYRIIKNPYVIITGISDYSESKLDDLDTTKNDVLMLYDLFKNIYGYNHVYSQHNKELGTKDDFDEFLIDHKNTARKLSKSKNDRIDSIIFLFAGHGCKQGIIVSNGEIVLFDRIKELFNNQNIKKLSSYPKIFCFDSCHGKNSTKSFTATIPDRGNIDITTNEHKDIFILFGSYMGTKSYNSDENGYLTLGISSILTENISKNEWSLDTIEKRIEKKVSNLTESCDFTQTVQTDSSLDYRVYFTKGSNFNNKTLIKYLNKYKNKYIILNPKNNNKNNIKINPKNNNCIVEALKKMNMESRKTKDGKLYYTVLIEQGCEDYYDLKELTVKDLTNFGFTIVDARKFVRKLPNPNHNNKNNRTHNNKYIVETLKMMNLGDRKTKDGKLYSTVLSELGYKNYDLLQKLKVDQLIDYGFTISDASMFVTKLKLMKIKDNGGIINSRSSRELGENEEEQKIARIFDDDRNKDTSQSISDISPSESLDTNFKRFLSDSVNTDEIYNENIKEMNGNKQLDEKNSVTFNTAELSDGDCSLIARQSDSDYATRMLEVSDTMDKNEHNRLITKSDGKNNRNELVDSPPVDINTVTPNNEIKNDDDISHILQLAQKHIKNRELLATNKYNNELNKYTLNFENYNENNSTNNMNVNFCSNDNENRIVSTNEYTVEFISKPFGMEWTETLDSLNLWVSCVTPWSQAARHGVVAGDMIIALNGIDIRNLGARFIHEKSKSLGLPLRITFRKSVGLNSLTIEKNSKMNTSIVNRCCAILKDSFNWELSDTERTLLCKRYGANSAEAAAAIFLAKYMIDNLRQQQLSKNESELLALNNSKNDNYKDFNTVSKCVEMLKDPINWELSDTQRTFLCKKSGANNAEAAAAILLAKHIIENLRQQQQYNN